MENYLTLADAGVEFIVGGVACVLRFLPGMTPATIRKVLTYNYAI